MKKIFFLMIGLMGFASVLSAGELVGPYSAAMEALVAEKAAESRFSPQWNASLSAIETTAGELLRANSLLTEENSQLNTKLTGLQQELQPLLEKNKLEKDQVYRKRFAGVDPSEVRQLKDELQALQREIEQRKKALETQRLALQTTESRLSLRKLKLKEIQVENKSRQLDRQTRDNMVLSGVKTDVAGLRSRKAKLEAQEKRLQEKIAALPNAEGPYSKEIQQVLSENLALEQEIVRLDSRRSELLQRQQEVNDEYGSAAKNPDVKKYIDLMARKLEVTSRLELLDKKRNELQSSKLQDLSQNKGTNLVKESVKLEEKNKFVEGQINNIRENIAVLEYQVNRLQRYKDRNKVSK